jgi:hypothetical protein
MGNLVEKNAAFVGPVLGLSTIPFHSLIAPGANLAFSPVHRPFHSYSTFC